jgi:hypothetical protein
MVHADPVIVNSSPICAWNPHQASLTQASISGPCSALGVVFLRENTLPVCDWGDPARSYQQLIHNAQGGPGAWQCVNVPTVRPCTFMNGKPTNNIYGLVATTNETTMSWANGAAIFGVLRLECVSSQTTAPVDTLRFGDVLRGLGVPASCTGSPSREAVLGEVDGGVVQHVRPATVRGQAVLRIHNGAGAALVRRKPGSGGGAALRSGRSEVVGQSFPRGHSTTVILAIQVLTNGTWVDHAVAPVLIAGGAVHLEVQDQVAPGMDVRLQIRGVTCQFESPEGFEIHDARIQVETCIPDQSNPGSCL